MLSELDVPTQDIQVENVPINSRLVGEPDSGPLASPTPNIGPQIIQQRSAESSTDEDIKDEFEEFVVDKARALMELVLTNCEEDRDEATSTIQMIKDLISSQDKVIHGGTISRLLQAIDTRSGINMTIVKALETQAKILAARKGPTKQITNNNNVSASGNSLIGILEAGMRDKTS